MKKYLDSDQINKLENLGINFATGGDIGELLELLPKEIEDSECNDDDYQDECLLKIYPISNRVSYEIVSDPLCGEYNPYELEIFKSDELVDSLFDALVWVITNKYMPI